MLNGKCSLWTKCWCGWMKNLHVCHLPWKIRTLRQARGGGGIIDGCFAWESFCFRGISCRTWVFCFPSMFCIKEDRNQLERSFVFWIENGKMMGCSIWVLGWVNRRGWRQQRKKLKQKSLLCFGVGFSTQPNAFSVTYIAWYVCIYGFYDEIICQFFCYAWLWID